VTKGYRFVLTYNLVYHGPGPQPLAADSDSKKRELQEIISAWKTSLDNRSDGCPVALAYMLDHEYTDFSLEVGWLKGDDQVRLLYLQDACRQNDFSIFLANIEHIVYGQCGDVCSEWRDLYFQAIEGWAQEFHSIGDVIEESLHLTVVYDDNVIMLRDIPLDKDDIVQPKPFSGDPDEEDWSGPTGNEGVSATHFYHSTVSFTSTHLFAAFIEVLMSLP
jgi:hypothetical protein